MDNYDRLMVTCLVISILVPLFCVMQYTLRLADRIRRLDAKLDEHLDADPRYSRQVEP